MRPALLAMLMGMCLANTSLLHAQTDDLYRWDAGVQAGMANYWGDFNGQVFGGSTASMGVLLRRVINPQMALKLTVTNTTLTGNSDALGKEWTDLHTETYTFSTRLIDVGVVYEYNFWKYGTGKDYRGAVRFTPYMPLGIGVAWVKPQNAQAFMAPNVKLGVGLKYKLSARWNLAAEWLANFTWTDKLDGMPQPKGIVGSGWFKNADAFGTLALSLTYSFSAQCKTCNKDY